MKPVKPSSRRRFALPVMLTAALLSPLTGCVTDIDEDIALVNNGVLETRTIENHAIAMNAFTKHLPLILGGSFRAILNARITLVSGDVYQVSNSASVSNNANVSYAGKTRIPAGEPKAGFLDYPRVTWTNLRDSLNNRQDGFAVYRSGTVTFVSGGYTGGLSVRGLMYHNTGAEVTFDVDVSCSGLTFTYSGKVNGRSEAGSLELDPSQLEE